MMPPTFFKKWGRGTCPLVPPLIDAHAHTTGAAMGSEPPKMAIHWEGSGVDLQSCGFYGHPVLVLTSVTWKKFLFVHTIIIIAQTECKSVSM